MSDGIARDATKAPSAVLIRASALRASRSDSDGMRVGAGQGGSGTARCGGTLAEDHGRNADLAERMVRKAENVTALQARKEGLIDIVAPNERALLRSLDGFHVKGAKAQRLQTSALEIRHVAAAELAALDTGAAEPLDETSWWRSFALVFGVTGLAVLALWGARRGRSSLRRRRRNRSTPRKR